MIVVHLLPHTQAHPEITPIVTPQVDILRVSRCPLKLSIEQFRRRISATQMADTLHDISISGDLNSSPAGRKQMC